MNEVNAKLLESLNLLNFLIDVAEKCPDSKKAMRTKELAEKHRSLLVAQLVTMNLIESENTPLDIKEKAYKAQYELISIVNSMKKEIEELNKEDW